MQTSTAPTNRTALETLTALLGRLDDNGTLPLYAQLQRALRSTPGAMVAVSMAMGRPSAKRSLRKR